MVLSLVTPIGSNFIKDWPAQHSVNADAIDVYAGAQCLTSHPIGSYTPQLTATTTNPTLGGSNDIEGYYYKIFDQIYTWGHFRFGSGFNAGSGTYAITLPFKVKTNIGIVPNIGQTPIVGNGNLWDESSAVAGGRQPLTCQLRTDQTIFFGVRMATGDFGVSHTGPITWAIDDGIKWFARYQRDPI